MPRSFLVKKKNKGQRSRRPGLQADKKANISGNSEEDKEVHQEWKCREEGILSESGEEQVDIETVDSECGGRNDPNSSSDIEEVLTEGEPHEDEEQTLQPDESAGIDSICEKQPITNKFPALTPEQIYIGKQENIYGYGARDRECGSQIDQPVTKKPRTLSFHSVEDLIRPDPKCLSSPPHSGIIQTEERGRNVSPSLQVDSFKTSKDRPIFADVPPRINDPNFWQNNVPNLPRAFNSYPYGHWPNKYLNERNGGYDPECVIKAPYNLHPGDHYPRERLMMAPQPPYSPQSQGVPIHSVLSTNNKPVYRRGVNTFRGGKFPSSPAVPGASPNLPWAVPHELSPENAPPLSPEKRRSREGEHSRYHCESCGKSYSTFSGLSKHKQFHCVNQVKKQFNCKHCDKTYTSLGALKMHIRTHTLPCKCKLCGKAFSRPWLLQGHVRTHTGEKPFTCPHCGRAFADRSNLRAHLQTHSDIKKYSCKTCSKTFSRMSLLLKHEDGGCSATFS